MIPSRPTKKKKKKMLKVNIVEGEDPLPLPQKKRKC